MFCLPLNPWPVYRIPFYRMIMLPNVYTYICTIHNYKESYYNNLYGLRLYHHFQIYKNVEKKEEKNLVLLNSDDWLDLTRHSRFFSQNEFSFIWLHKKHITTLKNVHVYCSYTYSVSQNDDKKKIIDSFLYCKSLSMKLSFYVLATNKDLYWKYFLVAKIYNINYMSAHRKITCIFISALSKIFHLCLHLLDNKKLLGFFFVCSMTILRFLIIHFLNVSKIPFSIIPKTFLLSNKRKKKY